MGPDVRLLAVVPGPVHHGVVQHGLRVAALLSGLGTDVTVTRSLDTPWAVPDLTHVQFTDVLFGADIGAAADAFVTWSRTAARPLVVTVHDVPDSDSDAARDARRRDGYRRVLAAADAVIVSAAHEAVGAVGLAPGLVPFLVPLPVERLAAPGPSPAWTDLPSVGVLGFVYPAKGHDSVLSAVSQLPGGGVRVVAIGDVSPGHEPLLAGLRRQARDLEVELLVTGPLLEADLHAAVRATTVPVAAYRTTGASASIATWLGCGRRPVVRTGRHTREIEARQPGSLLLYDDDDLADGLARALADPASTWPDVLPPRPAVAEAHLEVYRSCLA